MAAEEDKEKIVKKLMEILSFMFLEIRRARSGKSTKMGRCTGSLLRTSLARRARTKLELRDFLVRKKCT